MKHEKISSKLQIFTESVRGKSLDYTQNIEKLEIIKTTKELEEISQIMNYFLINNRKF
jgi:hypothetical protein